MLIIAKPVKFHNFKFLGGPIVDPMDHSLYGISSFTDTDGCEVMPQGFTTVMYYLPWISEVTGMQFMDCD